LLLLATLYPPQKTGFLQQLAAITSSHFIQSACEIQKLSITTSPPTDSNKLSSSLITLHVLPSDRCLLGPSPSNDWDSALIVILIWWNLK